MFLSDDDFRVVIGDAALRALSQLSAENRDNAVAIAVDEISSYLRPDYDVAAIFSAVGPDRNRMIVTCAVDIALYHLTAAMPQKLGSEVRKERYERAIRWLEGVQAGKIVPELPRAEADQSGAGSSTVFFSNRKLRHNW